MNVFVFFCFSFRPGWKRNHQGSERIQRQRRRRDSLQGYERTRSVTVHVATARSQEHLGVHNQQATVPEMIINQAVLHFTECNACRAAE